MRLRLACIRWPLSGSPSDFWSAPYYDYGSDTLYVGDYVGKLHKFSPVFNGALTEVTTSSWPVQLAHGGTNDTNPTTGPVYDSTSGRVFVGTLSITAGQGTGTGGSGGTGGYLYSVGSGNEGATSGTIYGASSPNRHEWGLRDSALVDSTAEDGVRLCWGRRQRRFRCVPICG